MKNCKVKGCKGIAKYQGLCLHLCSKHYAEFKKHKIRFENGYVVNENTGCWEWVHAKTIEGYGHFGFFGKRGKAHRFSWELYNGKIPKGILVCHSCDNPSCVNPEHLWLGTDADNARDKVAKNRQWRPVGKKHPLYGKCHSEETRKKISEAVSKAMLKGENHYNARLSKEDVLYIRNKFVKLASKKNIFKGEIYARLADAFGLCAGYVVAIIKRRKWKSI